MPPQKFLKINLDERVIKDELDSGLVSPPDKAPTNYEVFWINKRLKTKYEHQQEDFIRNSVAYYEKKGKVYSKKLKLKKNGNFTRRKHNQR